MSRRLAYRLVRLWVDRVLKGTRPAEMPIEQARQFVIVVNQETAQALGIAISESVLLRADE
jgi:putative ABC transport system substrate-binding protein